MEAIIQADVSITHRLLKYLGSAAFGFRAEIKSVRHALALLGREQTRRFVSLAVLDEMGQDKPNELFVCAAVRAKFCELVGDDVVMANPSSELFLLGALSLVEAMLDKPMTTVLRELPISQDLALALQGGANPLRPVLELAERYERGDWASSVQLAGRLGLRENRILQHYSQAVWWATEALVG